jgi:hypothetical protein
MMKQEQAQRFLVAAQRDYDGRVYDYIVALEAGGGSESTLSARQAARSSLLAAQQVLHLARSEVEAARERTREEARAKEDEGD